MKVLIPGGKGFIGSHLKACLTNHHHDVIAYGRQDVDRIIAAIDSGELQRQDCIINCAATVSGAEGLKECSFLDNDTHLHSKFREIVKAVSPKLLVNLNSVRSYSQSINPKVEKSIFSGEVCGQHSEYARMKRHVAHDLEDLCAEKSINFVDLVVTNVVGAGMRQDSRAAGLTRLVNDIFRAKKEGAGVCEIPGSPDITRDFIDVLDLAKIVQMIVAAPPVSPTRLNVATGIARSMRQVAELVADRLGYEGRFLWSESSLDIDKYGEIDINALSQHYPVQFRPFYQTVERVIEDMKFD